MHNTSPARWHEFQDALQEFQMRKRRGIALDNERPRPIDYGLPADYPAQTCDEMFGPPIAPVGCAFTIFRNASGAPLSKMADVGADGRLIFHTTADIVKR